MVKKRWFSKLVGYVSTLAIFFVAISPKTFNIPQAFQPWIVLGSVMWIIAFSSGVFSS